MHEREILLAALEKPRPEERDAFLAQACGTDLALRSRVESLLRASEVQDSFLERPAFETEWIGQKCTRPDEPSLDFLQPADDPQALGRLGYYEILEVLGHGGFGVVLKARDTKLDRIVAVKTLAQSLASSATARKRFVREAKAAAAVKHDNVVGIYHVADDGPVPYLVMECVTGLSLEAKLQQVGTLDLPGILRIGMQIASGLAAAHKQGLVHRDVKPGNILLENGVERVKITDFGLARAADDAAITKTGEVAGTPQYMSPEQAQGLPLDARSDLFSLGSVLYAMATGRSPFRAESTVAALRRVCDDTPRPIQEINSEIPDWLAEIINRLLAKRPSERFQTATEVAELLGRYLAHVQQPAIVPRPKAAVAAPPRSRVASRSWSIALVAVLAVASAISLTEASGVTKVMPTVIRIVRGEGTLVIEVADPTVQVSLDGEELSIRGAGVQELRLLPGTYRLHATKDGRPVKEEVVTITHDGRKVVTITREESSGSDSTGGAPAVVLTPSSIKAAELFQRADADGWVSLFNGQDLEGWQPIPAEQWRVENGVIQGSGRDSLLLSAVGDFEDFHLVVECRINAGGDAGVYFRMPIPQQDPSGHWGYRYTGLEAEIGAYKAPGHRTGALTAKGPMRILATSPTPLHGPNEWVRLELLALKERIQIFVNGKLVTDYIDSERMLERGHIALHSWESEKIKTNVEFRKVRIKKLTDGSGSASKTPAVQGPVGELKLLAKLDGHTDVVRGVAFLPDGRRVISVGRDRKVQIWDLESRNLVSTFQVEGYLRDATVSLDGRLVAVVATVGEKKEMAQVWDLEERELLWQVPQDFNFVNGIRFSPDGARVVTSGNPPGAFLWDLTTGKELKRLDVGDTPVTQAATYSAQGRLIALGAVGGVRLFDAESGAVLSDIRLPDNRHVNDLEFTATGKSLVCAQVSGNVHQIDVDARQVEKSMKASDAPVVRLRLLGNDRFILTTCFDATLRLLDIEQGAVIATMATEKGTNERLAISPDGRHAITASGEDWDNSSRTHKRNGDYALRLWQLPESVWPQASHPTPSFTEPVDKGID